MKQLTLSLQELLTVGHRLATVLQSRLAQKTRTSVQNGRCPNRVKNGPDGPEIRLPLFPRKRTQVGHRAVSVSCQYRKWPVLLDHLVGASEQRWRNLKAERLRSLKVDDELEFGGLLDREVRW